MAVPESKADAAVATADADQLTELGAANSLLVNSLEAGDEPDADDAGLEARISAYRASLASFAVPVGQPGSAAVADAGHLSSSPRSRDQGKPAAPLQHGEAGNTLLPALGKEGIDYTVGTADELDPSEWQVPPHCIPIHANVTTFDWSKLASVATFDIVMMDPPWQLATANPTRGVALGYSQLTDNDIRNLPIPQLQAPGGYLLVWVINSKYQFTLDLFDSWGYTLVDEVVWVKMTVNRRLFKSHGYYLQHAKEVCMVARKNPGPQDQQQQRRRQQSTDDSSAQQVEALVQLQQRWQELQQQRQQRQPQQPGSCGVGSDVIFSERRGQSQKPEEIYDLVEALVPNGRYLEIFARKNNLRNFWVSIGNEVTGTGLPEEDMLAFKQTSAIPGAVYGRGSIVAAAAAAAAGGVAG